jgi:RNA polymerase sigma-70 factor (sigma-E family)
MDHEGWMNDIVDPALVAGEPEAAETDVGEAFATVFQHHHARAVRLAFLLCGNGHLAEEIAADSFVRIYPQWRKGRVTELPPYLRRTVINEVRRRHRRRLLEQRHRVEKANASRGGRSLEDDAVERDHMIQALARLPPRQRMAVVLRFYEDLSEVETALAMGTSVGTVKAQVSRGLQRLRDHLEDNR